MLTFSPPVELDHDLLVHVLFQVQDVLLLGLLAVAALLLATTSRRAAAASSWSAARTASVASVWSFGHGSHASGLEFNGRGKF